MTALDTHAQAAPLDRAGADEGVTRMLSADTFAAVEAFAGSPLLAEGKVNLIGLDPIAERLGARWSLKREQVYEHVERTLTKHLEPDDYFTRVSETDFLVVQPRRGRYGGQALCLRCVGEVLNHFLGEAITTDLNVLEVGRLSRDGIEAHRVDPIATTTAAEHEEVRPASAPTLTNADGQWSPFVASNGRQVRVSCKLEPIIELRSHSVIGYRFARRVLDVATEEPLPAAEQERLSRADLERIDLATLARGVDRLRAQAAWVEQPSIIVPVSFVTLSTQRGRTAIAAAFKEAHALVQKGVICEIQDIAGVPESTLTSAVSLIRPFTLLTVGAIDPMAARTFVLPRGVGLRGLSFERPPGLHDERDLIKWMKAAVEGARRSARSVLIYRLKTMREAAVAGLVGATHAGVTGEE